MTTTTIAEVSRMTIHRGLAELKLLDSRILKSVAEINPVGLQQGEGLVDQLLKKEDFNTKANAAYQKVVDLINRKQKIKSAIVKINGTTMIKIGTVEMTIADAITHKTVISLKKTLAEKLKNSKRLAVSSLVKNNEAVAANAKTLGEAAVGKENIDAKKDNYEQIVKSYKDNNTFLLVDPLEIDKKVEELETEVSNYEMEIDAALSEINATTFIEIV